MSSESPLKKITDQLLLAEQLEGGKDRDNKSLGEALLKVADDANNLGTFERYCEKIKEHLDNHDLIPIIDVFKEAAGEYLFAPGADIEERRQKLKLETLEAAVLEKYPTDASIEAQQGKSSLCIAAIKGDIEFVEKLIKAGADVNYMDNLGQRPLYLAMYYDSSKFEDKKKIITALLEAGADTQAKTSNKNNAPTISEYAKRDTKDLHKLLQPYIPPEIRAEEVIKEAIKNAGITYDKQRGKGKGTIGEKIQKALKGKVIEALKGGADASTLSKALRYELELCEKTLTDSIRSKALQDIATNLTTSENEFLALKTIRQAYFDSKRRKHTEAKARILFNQLKDQVVTKLKSEPRSAPNLKSQIIGKLRVNKDLTAITLDAEVAPAPAPPPVTAPTPQEASAAGDTAEELTEQTRKLQQLEASLVALYLKNGTLQGGESALHIASSLSELSDINNLINAGADVKATDKDGLTPLHKAVQNGRVQAAQALLDAGADIEAKSTRHKMTPLHVAVTMGQKEAAEALIKRGADIEAKDTIDLTPLLLASNIGEKEIIEQLIKNGADIKATDEKGFTPLHYAAAQGHKDAVEALIAAGADFSAKSNDDLTPREVVSQKHPEILVLLKAKEKELAEKIYKKFLAGYKEEPVSQKQLLEETQSSLKSQENFTLVDYLQWLKQFMTQNPEHLNSSPKEYISQFLDFQEYKDGVKSHLNSQEENTQSLWAQERAITKKLEQPKYRAWSEAIKTLKAKKVEITDENIMQEIKEGVHTEQSAEDELKFAYNPSNEEILTLQKETKTSTGEEISDTHASKTLKVNYKPTQQEIEALIGKPRYSTQAAQESLKSSGTEPSQAALLKELKKPADNGKVAQQVKDFRKGFESMLAKPEAISKSIKFRVLNQVLMTPPGMPKATVDKFRQQLLNDSDFRLPNNINISNLEAATAFASLDLLKSLGSNEQFPDIAQYTAANISESMERALKDPDVRAKAILAQAYVRFNKETKAEIALTPNREKKFNDILIDHVKGLLDQGVADSYFPEYIAQKLIKRQHDGANGGKTVKIRKLKTIAMHMEKKVREADKHHMMDEETREKMLSMANEVALQKAAKAGDKNAIEASIMLGVDINSTDKNKKTALHIAAEEGHKEAVEVLLAAGADPTLKDEKGQTPTHYALNADLSIMLEVAEDDAQSKKSGGAPAPSPAIAEGDTALHLAAAEGNLDLVTELLARDGENKIDVNTQNEYGDTALHAAVEKGGIEAVKKLIESGADLNVEGSEDRTPLHIAASSGNISLVNELIKAKADLNITDKNKKTALHIAAEKGHKEAVQALLAAGADPTLKDEKGQTPLEAATDPAIQALLKAPTINPELEEQTTKVEAILAQLQGASAKDPADKAKDLQEAVKSGNVDTVIALLEEDKDLINSKDEKGNNLLHLAAEATEKHKEMMELLIKKAPHLLSEKNKDPDPQTPAALYQNKLEVKGNLDQALMQAAIDQDIVATEVLLAYQQGIISDKHSLMDPGILLQGAQAALGEYEAQTLKKYTTSSLWRKKKPSQSAIHVACENNDFAAVQSLTSLAAASRKRGFLKQKNENGKSPLHLAGEHGNEEIVALLQSQSKRLGLTLPEYNAAEIEKARELEALETNIIKQYSKIKKSRSKKPYAGVGPITDKHGNSALFLAAINSDLSAVESLIEKGADPNIGHPTPLEGLEYVIQEGENPKFSAIHTAAANSKEPEVKILTTLAAKMGKTDFLLKKDPEGKTPLDWAADGFNIEMVELLKSQAKELELKRATHLKELEAEIFGYYPGEKNTSKGTALHLAAFKGNTESVIKLLEAGADIEAQDTFKQTPLHLAAKNGHVESVKALLAAGADINAQGDDLATPLHLAAENGHVESVKALLAAGADMSLKDGVGKTAREVAKDNIVQIFEERDHKIAQGVAKESERKASYAKERLADLKRLIAGNEFEALAKMPEAALNMFDIPDDLRAQIHEAKDAQFQKKYKKHHNAKNAGLTVDGSQGASPVKGRGTDSAYGIHAQAGTEAIMNAANAHSFGIVPENLDPKEKKEWQQIERNSVSLDRKLEEAKAAQEAVQAKRRNAKRKADAEVQKLEVQAKKHTKDVTEYANQLLQLSEDLPEGKKKVERLSECKVSKDPTKRKVTTITHKNEVSQERDVNESFKGKKVFMWRYGPDHKKIQSDGVGSKKGYEVDWIEFDKEGKVIGGFVGPPPEHASIEDNLITEIHLANKEQRKLVASIKLAKDIGSSIKPAGAAAPAPRGDKGPQVSTVESIGAGLGDASTTDGDGGPDGKGAATPALMDNMTGLTEEGLRAAAARLANPAKDSVLSVGDGDDGDAKRPRSTPLSEAESQEAAAELGARARTASVGSSAKGDGAGKGKPPRERAGSTASRGGGGTPDSSA